MTSNISSHNAAGRTKRASFGGIPGASTAHLLDRSKPGIRGSTPDSEALVSSDDEQDHLNRLHPVTSNPGPKPARRGSWLTEVQQTSNRKSSLGGSGPFSPASPSAVAPYSDQVPWGTSVSSTTAATMGRGHTSSTSFPWSNNIWNTESQKWPPQRLTEVLPSPTSVVPPGSAGLYGDEPLRSPPLRDNGVDPAIPFAIPLQPTPKTYRSQSYSVGQLDPESMNPPPVNNIGHTAYGRPRVGTSYAGLQHRPSRPSMLGELSHDPSLLEQLREVEDDEESSDLSDSGIHLPTEQARTIEQLARENAMLRQAAAEREENNRNLERGPSNSTMSQPPRSLNQSYHQRLPNDVPEGYDYASYDLDDPDPQKVYRYEGLNGRRFSEYGTKSGAHYIFAGTPENRPVEGVKKGHWQSSLGFGGIGEAPQSRRHSFADVPTRQNSIGSGGETQAAQEVGELAPRTNGKHGSPGGYGDGMARPSQGDSGEYAQFHSSQNIQERLLELGHLRDRDFAVNYFSRTDPSMRGGEDNAPLSSTSLHQAYMQSQYGRPQLLAHSQHRPNQLLYIVTFKAQRADVFYASEGTGLQVRKGDLVIVEADRGTDLGTVSSETLPWGEAKELKEKFMEEHHKWLMVFSRHGQNGTIAGPNPNGQPHPGALGGSSGHSGGHDLPSGEIKPKMIKRLAQPHEIQTLREKEGAEAKAKRACQQKVVEHRLNMEILDAEFQMDWKKLTFFYFADAYINFNPLVTDLFKIYKTRIWMSAINTAAIGSPGGSHHLPSGPGHGAFGSELDEYSARRHPRHDPGSASTGTPQAALGAPDHGWHPNREIGPIGGMTYPQLYGQPFQAPGFDMRQLSQYPMDYRQLGPHGVNPQPTFNSLDYDSPSLHHTSSFTAQPEGRNDDARERPDLTRDWTQNFQGLSLGPRA